MKNKGLWGLVLAATVLATGGCGIRPIVNPTHSSERPIIKRDLKVTIRAITNMGYFTEDEILRGNWFLAKQYARMGNCLLEEMYNQYDPLKIKEYEEELGSAKKQFNSALEHQ
jgi:hypothetical protein